MLTVDQCESEKEPTLRLPHPSADSGTFRLSGQNPSERQKQKLCEGLKPINRSPARVNIPSSCRNLWNDVTLGARTWSLFSVYLIEPFQTDQTVQFPNEVPSNTHKWANTEKSF